MSARASARFCDQCGSPVTPGDAFCQSCGRSLGAAQVARRAPGGGTVSTGRRLALAVPMAMASAIVAVGFFLPWTERDAGLSTASATNGVDAGSSPMLVIALVTFIAATAFAAGLTVTLSGGRGSRRHLDRGWWMAVGVALLVLVGFEGAAVDNEVERAEQSGASVEAGVGLGIIAIGAVVLVVTGAAELVILSRPDDGSR